MGLKIRANKDRKGIYRGFYVSEEFFKPHRHTKYIPKPLWPTLGFSPEMSLEEARARASQLNRIRARETRSQAGAARRAEDLKLVHRLYLPETLLTEFESRILSELAFKNEKRLVTFRSRWSSCKKVILKLEVEPKDFFDRQALFFLEFRDRRYSLDYISKLVRLLNEWGEFYGKKTNSFFRALPNRPKSGAQVEEIINAREGKKGVRSEANPLTTELLASTEATMKHNGLSAQWRWLFAALWLGLRPTEADSITPSKNGALWKIEFDAEKKCEILKVFQTKLIRVKRDRRWKPIALLFPEQRQAVEWLSSGQCQRPLAKTVRRYFGDGFDSYSPRKGATDLFLSLGYELPDASIQLGHLDLNTTWRIYKDRHKFNLPQRDRIVGRSSTSRTSRSQRPIRMRA